MMEGAVPEYDWQGTIRNSTGGALQGIAPPNASP
jgi:hypothetical protein